jgi:hypothetical protein
MKLGRMPTPMPVRSMAAAALKMSTRTRTSGLRQLLLHPAVVHALVPSRSKATQGASRSSCGSGCTACGSPGAAQRVDAAVRHPQLPAHQVFGHVGGQAQRHVGLASQSPALFGLAA